jgi:succinate dehydrogenase / fumarate reductase, cytochrome b subunit
MPNSFFKSVFWSTVGKKLVIAVSGLGIFLFVIIHLLGNLTLLTGNPDTFNAYSHKLTSLGPILYFLEFLLAAAFLFHITLAVWTTFKNWGTRSNNYVVLKSAGKESKKTLSSITMIYTGTVIIIFTVLHLITFKYGPGIAQGYFTYINGEKMRDLYRLVLEVFHKQWYVIWYVAAMVFLGFHLRHAFWSGLQSLGANNQKLSPYLYGAGLVFALMLAFGFIFIPLWVYFAY